MYSIGVMRLTAALVLAISTGTAAAAPVAIKAAHLIDVRNGHIIDAPVVIVEGERIVAVGANLPIPEGAKVIDLGARTLVPGLIDAHVHIAGGGGPNAGVARSVLKGAANARKTLNAGFTTVRSMGGTNYAGIALRDAIADGDVVGPRLFDAGGLLGVTGGHCSGPKLAPDAHQVDSPGTADSPDAFVKKVRERIKYGADFIKICITGGFTSGYDPTVTQFTEEVIRAVVVI
jgi:imidazolonepropionase-like amidohydrolase